VYSQTNFYHSRISFIDYWVNYPQFFKGNMEKNTLIFL